MIKFVQKVVDVKKSSIFQEKLFSDTSDLYEAVLMEGIKCIDFWQAPPKDESNLGGRDTDHWINVMSSCILKVSPILRSCPQWFFFPLESDKENIKLPNGLSKLRVYTSKKIPEAIISEVQDRIKTEKVRGELKYKKLLDLNGGKFLYDPEGYIYFFKSLALTIIGINNGGPFDYYGLDTISVDYMKNIVTNEVKLKGIISNFYKENFGPNLCFQ